MSAQRSDARRGVGAALWSIVVLCLWLGAVIYFVAAVAPAAFRALPSRALAGALIGQTLPVIFVSGLCAGILVALLALSGQRAIAWRGVQLGGGVAVAVLCAVGQFIVDARIDKLRMAIGPAFETLSPSDPARLAFARLHMLSVASLGLAVVVGLVVLGITCRSVVRYGAPGAR
ncbi:MAG TPA: DUF4149 domain-containing protein [Gemmatimonadaceae bacterium]|nr:DUF4149 domain-containing protein [Gemmatimonadaceae bacterium]